MEKDKPIFIPAAVHRILDNERKRRNEIEQKDGKSLSTLKSIFSEIVIEWNDSKKKK